MWDFLCIMLYVSCFLPFCQLKIYGIKLVQVYMEEICLYKHNRDYVK